MISNKDTFNINQVAIPFTKQDFNDIVPSFVKNGYIPITYDQLIETMEEISIATQYSVTVNPNSIFASSNNPLERTDVIIQVEGTQTYTEFVDNVVKNTEDYTWTNFITYSETFKDEIKNMKCQAYKKYLWNYHNIDTWFSEKNIGLLDSDKNLLVTDFETFKDRVLNTDDYNSFIDCCKEEDVKKAITFIVKAGIQLLKKYKVELNSHINNDNKRQEKIVIKNPIISKIFMLPSAATKCRKDWPRIRFVTLDKKSFDALGVWDS